MTRALRASAAALGFWVAGSCASDDADGRSRDGAADRPADAGERDAAPAVDGSAGDARVPVDAGDSAVPAAGPDHLRFDAVAPSPQGVVRVAFDAPEDAVAFVVTVDPGAVPRPIQLIQLAGPAGLLWSALEAGPHAFEPVAVRNAGDVVPLTVMLPSAPELPLAAGRYEVVVRAGMDGAAEVTADVVVKRASAPPAAGTLRVATWLVQAAGLDAEAAASDPHLQAAFAAFADIFAAAGIELSFAPPRELAGAAAAELAVLEGEPETAELLALLAAEDAGSRERALHVVFVARIDAGAGRTVRGRTSGVPGPPSHPALGRRGAVIIGLETAPAGASRFGELLAHEAAHYLGLRHSSEVDGRRHDPLADTPECPAERASQTSGDGVPLLRAEDCADLDGGNLLFYTPPQDDETAQDELSDDQAYVLLHSPLVDLE